MFWPLLGKFGYFDANSRTFWRNFTGLNSVVVYQNWQISDMIIKPFFPILCVQSLDSSVWMAILGMMLLPLSLYLSPFVSVCQSDKMHLVQWSIFIPAPFTLFFLTNVHFGYKTHIYAPPRTLVLLVQAWYDSFSDIFWNKILRPRALLRF